MPVLNSFLVLLLAVFSLGPSWSHADTFYDVGANTTFASLPLALMAVAADNVGPFAVTVRVRAADGQSYAALDLNPAIYALNPQPSAGLILEPLPGALPIISGSGNTGLRVSGLAHVTIRGFGIQGGFNDSLRVEAAPFFSADALKIQGSIVSAMTVKNSADARLTQNLLAPVSGLALLLQNSLRAYVAKNAVPSTSLPNYGFVVQDSHRAWLDQNNSGGSDQAYNVFSSANVTLSANVAIRRGGARGVVLDSSSGAWVLKNLLIGQSVGLEALASTGCAVMQNTVWEHSTAGLYTRSNCAPLLLRNNLWQGFLALFLDSATQAGLNSDYQGFKSDGQFGVGSSSYATLSSWQGTAHDLNSLYSDASFVNSSGSQVADFKLSAGSPMAGFGANLSTYYNSDFFLNPLPGGITAWDPGFHVASAPQATPSPTPVLPTATPSPSATASPTVTPTATQTPPATGTPAPSGTETRTMTMTPSSTVTPYAIQKDRVVTYPNPYRPGGGIQHIAYDAAEEAVVKILDMNGQPVMELAASNIQAPLGHAVWDGRDKEGRAVAPGLYFCIVRTSKATRFKRFSLLY